MKKSISAILSILAILMFAFFAIASGSSDDGETKTQDSDSVAAETVDNSSLGDYQVEIKSARLTENYEGKATVVVTYGFTNNSESPAAFWLSVSDTVYQNGVGLEKAYVLKDGDPYDEANQNKEIKSGVTLDVEVAYILNDAETEIEVEVKEYMGFSDDVITKTFSLS